VTNQWPGVNVREAHRYTILKEIVTNLLEDASRREAMCDHDLFSYITERKINIYPKS
jgi:hypothetical protein